jgi:nucleotide-binding universal stress UspA family protein
VLRGSPGSALPALAGDAALLVLGHRGRGGFAGMLLGSVALRILARARCPVAVARGGRREMNRVLVGIDVDDVARGHAPLGFAFTEAVLRGAGLAVLHVWEDRGYFSPDPMGASTRDHPTTLDSEQHERLEALLDPWRRAHPDVAVDVVIEGGSASRGLVDASGYADLLVVGGRPHSEPEGMQVGGLAYVLLHHAYCPVVIVPEK